MFAVQRTVLSSTVHAVAREQENTHTRFHSFPHHSDWVHFARRAVRVPPLAASRGCAPFWRRTGTRLCQPTLRIDTARPFVPPTRGRPRVASSPCNLGAYVGTASRWAVRALVCCTLSNALTLGTLVVTVTLSDGPFCTVSSAPIPGPRSWCCWHSPTHSAYRRERSAIRRSAGPASSTSALVVTRVTPACRE